MLETLEHQELSELELKLSKKLDKKLNDVIEKEILRLTNADDRLEKIDKTKIEILEQMIWYVERFKADIQEGDIVAEWRDKDVRCIN